MNLVLIAVNSFPPCIETTHFSPLTSIAIFLKDRMIPCYHFAYIWPNLSREKQTISQVEYEAQHTDLDFGLGKNKPNQAGLETLKLVYTRNLSVAMKSNIKITSFLAVPSTASFILTAQAANPDETSCAAKRIVGDVEVRSLCPIPWTQNCGE